MCQAFTEQKYKPAVIEFDVNSVITLLTSAPRKEKTFHIYVWSDRAWITSYLDEHYFVFATTVKNEYPVSRGFGEVPAHQLKAMVENCDKEEEIAFQLTVDITNVLE